MLLTDFSNVFMLFSALKSSNAYKEKGFAVSLLFQYLFRLIFSHQSMYMDSKTGKSMRDFSSDTAYRFQNAIHINWINFTTKVAATIIKKDFFPATSDKRVNALIIDDSVFGRNRSKQVDKRSAGYKRRVLSQTKGTDAMLELLKQAKQEKLPADYVLFDSWFSSPASLLAVEKLGYDVIAMIKKT